MRKNATNSALSLAPGPLCVGEGLAVVQDDLKFGIFAVEVVAEAVQVAGALPFAHRQVMQQVVAAGLRGRGRDFVLREDPFQAFDGQPAHVLRRVAAGHDDVHARQAAHRADVDHVVLRGRVAEPRGHQVLDAVHGRRRHRRLLVRLRDPKVERRESPVHPGHIDPRLEVRMINRKTLNYFHGC